MVAKANLDSFAHGSSTENSDRGPTKNPADITRVPGGSSGGSAAATALGLAPFSLGSDTGGSIRLPASFTGTVGLKPTYGSTSRYGVIAMASSTDVMGPLTNSVQDAAIIYDVIAGIDKNDSTTIQRSEDDYSDLDSSKKYKIGVIAEHFAEGLQPGVEKSINQSIQLLKDDGHEVSEVSMPDLDHALACYYIIVPAEIASNLSKFDGIRFGISERDKKALEDVYGDTRQKGFNSENKRRIMIGNYVLSSGFYDAYYKKAQAVRTLLVQAFDKAFAEFDLLVGPVAPMTAFKLGENTEDPLQMYLADVMTVGMSLAGLPAISVPVEPANGLPVGLQITGNKTADKQVLELAKRLQELQNA